MIPSGGNFFLNKLRAPFFFPLHILKLRPYLKKQILYTLGLQPVSEYCFYPGFIFFGVKNMD